MEVLKDFDTYGVSKKMGEKLSKKESDSLGTRKVRELLKCGFLKPLEAKKKPIKEY